MIKMKTTMKLPVALQFAAGWATMDMYREVFADVDPRILAHFDDELYGRYFFHARLKALYCFAKCIGRTELTPDQCVEYIDRINAIVQSKEKPHADVHIAASIISMCPDGSLDYVLDSEPGKRLFGGNRPAWYLPGGLNQTIDDMLLEIDYDFQNRDNGWKTREEHRLEDLIYALGSLKFLELMLPNNNYAEKREVLSNYRNILL